MHNTESRSSTRVFRLQGSNAYLFSPSALCPRFLLGMDARVYGVCFCTLPPVSIPLCKRKQGRNPRTFSNFRSVFLPIFRRFSSMFGRFCRGTHPQDPLGTPRGAGVDLSSILCDFGLLCGSPWARFRYFSARFFLRRVSSAPLGAWFYSLRLHFGDILMTLGSPCGNPWKL